MNGNIVYYYPDKELLFFGEIYDKGGISLTKESLRKTAKQKISKLEEGVALKVGDDSGKVIIEIMDPDCPYCRKYHDYIEKASQDTNIDRRILLDPRIHQSAIPKIKHIICSNDPKRAYEAVMSGAVKEYQDCPNSEAIMAKHVEQIDMLGVNATPSFVINSQVVMGFDKEKIEAYLRSSN
jgi:thiol:disulfide interchange protein DsbC